MKKILLKCILILSIICICCGCSNNDDKPQGEENYLGGYGEFQQEYGKTLGLPAFYDDEYIYVQANTYDKLVAFDRDNGEYRPICLDASCEHDKTGCKQNIGMNMRSYFVFNNKLYYTIADRDIYDATTETIVHTIVLPKELQEAEDSDRYKASMYIATPINEDYLQINCLQWAYIVDKDFNVIYWHKRGESFHFAMIDGDKYYYTSEFALVKVELTTGEETFLATEGPVVFVDTNSKGVFYTTTYDELFMYDLNTQESTLVADNILAICCSEEYIYYIEQNLNETGENQNKQIKAIDEKGNVIYSITNPLDSLFASEIYIIDEKLYAHDTFNEKILICNLDGSDQIVSSVEQ